MQKQWYRSTACGVQYLRKKAGILRAQSSYSERQYYPCCVIVIIIIYIPNCMKNIQYIQIEPQVVEIAFTDDKNNPTSVMKIKNLTQTLIHDLKFSIFNPDKFIFTPETFNLQAYEEKIIKIELKPQTSKKQFKQFAYLKSPSPLINKRITLFVGKSNQNNSFVTNSNNSRLFQDQEPSSHLELDRRRPTQEENLDPHSLSNRAYNIAQAKAHEKMLMEKDSLIDKMEMEIQTKIAQCLKYQQEIRVRDRDVQIEKRRANQWMSQVEEWKYRHEQLRIKLANSQKSAIKAKQQQKSLKIEQQRLRIQNDKINLILRREMQEQKRIYELELNRYEVRLSQLQSAIKEQSLQSMQKVRFQQQLRIREEELRRARLQLDTARRYEMDNSRLDEEKQSLMLQVNGYLNEIEYYKQQMIKSRLEIEKRLGAEKERSAITLEELKIENQVLIKKKIQLQNALQTANKELEILKSRVKNADSSPIKNSFRDSRQQELLSLKQQNVILLERIETLLNKSCKQCEAYKSRIEELEEEIKQIHTEFTKEKQKIKQQQSQNTKSLKKELQSLNQTAINKIKKLTADNKKLKKQIKTTQEEQKKNEAKNKQEMQSTKLSILQNQLAQMREQLHLVKTKQKVEERKVGIRNQSKQIEESRSNKSNSMIRDDKFYEELGQLKELEKIVKIEQRRLEEQNGIVSRDGIFGIVDMFRVIRERLNTEREWWRQEESQYLNEIKGLKLRLVSAQGSKEKQNYMGNSGSYFTNQANKKLYEFIQQQMKNQYKKLNDTIQLLQQKYEIFKRKMLSEFRVRLMDIIYKKDRKQLLKLQPLLEKLIESVYNTSHKQALYSREVKRKLELRKQNKDLRGKNTQLQLLLQDKKGVCTRDPVKVILRKEEDLFETIKLEATLMSCRAQNQRLKEEIEIMKQTNSSATEQHKISLELLQKRQDEVSKLKSQIVEIDNLHRQQLTNAVTQLDMMKGQFLKISQLEQKVSALSGKERQNQQLKEDLLRKKQIIKGLKQKEKALNQALQNTHRELEHQQHSVDKARTKEQVRLQQMIGQFKQKNKQQKTQIEKKQDNIKQLKQEIDKKNAFIASQKMSSSNTTGRNEREKQKTETYINQIQQLKSDNKKLSDKNSELKNSNAKLHNQIDNMKSKIGEVEKQVSKLNNDLKNQENEYLIKQKSLQSNIRGMIEMLRRLWRYIEFKVRKISSEFKIKDSFDQIVKDHNNIDVIKLFNGFESMLNMIE